MTDHGQFPISTELKDEIVELLERVMLAERTIEPNTIGGDATRIYDDLMALERERMTASEIAESEGEGPDPSEGRPT